MKNIEIYGFTYVSLYPLYPFFDNPIFLPVVACIRPLLKLVLIWVFSRAFALHLCHPKFADRFLFDFVLGRVSYPPIIRILKYLKPNSPLNDHDLCRVLFRVPHIRVYRQRCVSFDWWVCVWQNQNQPGRRRMRDKRIS